MTINFIMLHSPDGSPVYVQHDSILAMEETRSERTLVSLVSGKDFHVRENAQQIVASMDKACKS